MEETKPEPKEFRVALEDVVLMLEHKKDTLCTKVAKLQGTKAENCTAYLQLVIEKNIYIELYEKTRNMYDRLVKLYGQ